MTENSITTIHLLLPDPIFVFTCLCSSIAHAINATTICADSIYVGPDDETHPSVMWSLILLVKGHSYLEAAAHCERRDDATRPNSALSFHPF